MAIKESGKAERIGPEDSAKGTEKGVRIVVIDDHERMRSSLCRLLDQEPGLEVVSEAGDGRTGLEAVLRFHPDVVVVDLALPDLSSIEVVHLMRETAPQSRVIALSMFSERHLVRGVMAAGAAGYLLRKAVFNELIPAVRQVMAGRTFLGSGIAA